MTPEVEYLGDTSYRCVYLNLRDFFQYVYAGKKPTPYYVRKMRNFVENLPTNFIIKKFKNYYFQSLASVPKVQVYKLNKKWVAKIWIVDELYSYDYPFSFPIRELLKSSLNKHQLSSLVYVINTLSSESIEKNFDIKSYINSYNYSNSDSRKVKKYVIQYIHFLYNHGIIDGKLYVVKEKKQYSVKQLTTRNISEGFIVYELL